MTHSKLHSLHNAGTVNIHSHSRLLFCLKLRMYNGRVENYKSSEFLIQFKLARQILITLKLERSI